MLLPVFLCLRWLYPPSTWGHCWQTLYSKSHTIGTLSSERTFQLKNCVRNPTKIRDTAKLIHKRLNFSVGKLMERNKNTASSVVWICRPQCTRIPTHMYMTVAYTHTHTFTRVPTVNSVRWLATSLGGNPGFQTDGEQILVVWIFSSSWFSTHGALLVYYSAGLGSYLEHIHTHTQASTIQSAFKHILYSTNQSRWFFFSPCFIQLHPYLFRIW